MRLVMTRVLPEPAPARTSSVPSVTCTASCCWGLRSFIASLQYRTAQSRSEGRTTQRLQISDLRFPNLRSQIANKNIVRNVHAMPTDLHFSLFLLFSGA